MSPPSPALSSTLIPQLGATGSSVLTLCLECSRHPQSPLILCSRGSQTVVPGAAFVLYGHQLVRNFKLEILILEPHPRSTESETVLDQEGLQAQLN